MKTITYSSIKNIFALLILVPTILLGLTFSTAQAQTTQDLQLIINNLMAQIAALQAQQSGQGDGQCLELSNTMYLGSNDASTNGEVTKLQKHLTASGHYVYGETTGYYGASTEKAVKSWQAANGVVYSGNAAATGYGVVGVKTRAAFASGCSDVPPINTNSPFVDLKINGSDGPLTLSPQQAIFSWKTSGFDSCRAYGSGIKWIGDKETSGSETVWVANEKENVSTHSLVCENTAGDEGRDEVTVTHDYSGGSTSTPNSKINITSPNGGEKWVIGETNTITWAPYSYNPDINPTQDVVAHLVKKKKGKFVEVGKIIENGKASIHWTGNVGVLGNKAYPGNYYIKVENLETGEVDYSDESFKLVNGDTKLYVKYPNRKDDVIKVGEENVIKWRYKGIESLSIGLYADDKWVAWIAKDLTGKDMRDRKYVWTPEVGGVADNSAYRGQVFKIYITGSKSGGGYFDDKSDRAFKIVTDSEATGITVVSPNGGEEWRTQQVNTITWRPYNYDPDINPATDVTAYLDKKIDGEFVEVGRILENGKASIHTHLEIDKSYNYAPSGKYYVRLINNESGATDRSDSPFEIVNHGNTVEQAYINSSPNDPDSSTLVVDNDSATSDEYVVHAFDIEVGSESDALVLSEVYVDVMVANYGNNYAIANGHDDVIDNVHLEINGRGVDGVATSLGLHESGDSIGDSRVGEVRYLFDFDEGATLYSGSDNEAQVLISFEGQDGNYKNGVNVYTETNGTYWEVESVSGIDGSVSGIDSSEVHTLLSSGIIVEFGDSDTEVVNVDGSSDYVTFTMGLAVTAVEQDVYIPTDMGDSIEWHLETSSGSVISDGSTQVSLYSTADEDSDYFVIDEGATEVLSVNVLYIPQDLNTTARLVLDSINFSENPETPDQTQELLPETDYRSNTVIIVASFDVENDHFLTLGKMQKAINLLSATITNR
jgi:peptidoglycan hydrolase-like protein with peptidoglycan-binding domain